MRSEGLFSMFDHLPLNIAPCRSMELSTALMRAIMSVIVTTFNDL